MEWLLYFSGAILLCCILALLLDRRIRVPRYRGPITDHFDGKRFYNIGWEHKKVFGDMTESMDTRDLLKMVSGKRGWKHREITPIIPEKQIQSGILVTYIGHATVLVQTPTVTFLTDPVWAYRASPFSWAGPKRYQNAGVELQNLPKIDFVLLSHNHYDHLDVVALKRIAKTHKMPIYTPLGNSRYLRKKRIKGGVDMDWRETRIQGDTKITCVPAQHFSSRGITDRNVTLWSGFVVETPAGSIYFAGDTAYGIFIEDIRKQFPHGFDIGLLPIGAFRPEGMMKPVHTGPREAKALGEALGVRNGVAIHFGTFPLALDEQDEPVDVLNSLGEHNIITMENGGQRRYEF